MERSGVLKVILRKVLGKASLSYESMSTTLCDAEAIINSRALMYVSEDSEDLMPLTPSCFLCETQEIGTPDCDMLYHNKLNNKFRYKQKILDALRLRFRNEYLSQLILKNKKSEMRKINVGDVVLIGDDIHKRIDWPLAPVIEDIPGKDGNARVFMLKTKNGVLKRAIQRLYPLEISHEDAELAQALSEKEKTRKHADDSNVIATNGRDKRDILTVNSENSNVDNVTTRSGCVIRKPKRFEK